MHAPGKPFELMKLKGVLYFDYIDDITRLDEIELLARERFYNRLSDREFLEDY